MTAGTLWVVLARQAVLQGHRGIPTQPLLEALVEGLCNRGALIRGSIPACQFPLQVRRSRDFDSGARPCNCRSAHMPSPTCSTVTELVLLLVHELYAYHTWYLPISFGLACIMVCPLTYCMRLGQAACHMSSAAMAEQAPQPDPTPEQQPKPPPRKRVRTDTRTYMQLDSPTTVSQVVSKRASDSSLQGTNSAVDISSMSQHQRHQLQQQTHAVHGQKPDNKQPQQQHQGITAQQQQQQAAGASHSVHPLPTFEQLLQQEAAKLDGSSRFTLAGGSRSTINHILRAFQHSKAAKDRARGAYINAEVSSITTSAHMVVCVFWPRGAVV